MKNYYLFIIVIINLLYITGCVTLNAETAKNMTTQGICDLVNPSMYISTFEEREAAYRELERRGATCGVHHLKIHQR